MEQCYDFYDCKESECVKRTDDRNCWEIEGTLCEEHVMDHIKKLVQISGGSVCEYCSYYKQYH